MRIGLRGQLEFIGIELGNYAGPVFDPKALEQAVEAWGRRMREDSRVTAVDLSGLRERSPFLELVRRRGLPGWGTPVAVATNACPEVDLTGGWQTLLERHKSKQRSSWRRKAARLERLGSVEFLETGDNEAIEAAMPRMTELWRQRWDGQRVHASFAEHADFQRRAAVDLAVNDLALLSTLRLDGEIVAFAYGVRGPGSTSSYVLAHDDGLRRYSPGLLLLLHVLEAACRRGDRIYDFSLGDAPYKAMWGTDQQRVYRAIWGRGRWLRGAWSAARSRARSVGALRELKLRGWQTILGRSVGQPQPPDEPGLPAGDTRTTFVYELAKPSSAVGSLRTCSYRQMRELLSPRLLHLALERSFRGDQLLLVEAGNRLAGVVWLAAKARRSSLAGGGADACTVEVYYHPVALPPGGLADVVQHLAAAAPGLVVTNAPLSAPYAIARGRQAPDPGTWTLIS
jgi:CelD/BcsL family acetyltransferase involved in cellulose biosynthesis